MSSGIGTTHSAFCASAVTLAQAISCSNVHDVCSVHEFFWFCFVQVSTTQFVVSHLLSWHVRAMEQICQYLHYQPPLRILVLLTVLFLTLKGQDTDDASLSNSTVACVSIYLLLLTIRIAFCSISTRRPTKKLILQVQLLRLKLPNLSAKLLSQVARLE